MQLCQISVSGQVSVSGRAGLGRVNIINNCYNLFTIGIFIG